ncbi:MAG: hypothetical protein ABI471_08190 [Sphingomonas bacterium]
MRVLISVLAVALAGSAVAADRAPRQTDEEKLAAALKGLVPDKPMECLTDRTQASQLEAYGPTILYRVSKNLVYRNDTGGGCEHIASGDILVTQSISGRLCRGDIGRTVSPSPHFQTGSCSLGSFIPYRRPK